mmetsp:Transcript_178279/g.571503  ORF Transcript_178279/g.571503 Transcript_178279/m.571503 type:complete len:243 (-) Transcript_178279:786-1514(-)
MHDDLLLRRQSDRWWWRDHRYRRHGRTPSCKHAPRGSLCKRGRRATTERCVARRCLCTWCSGYICQGLCTSRRNILGHGARRAGVLDMFRRVLRQPNEGREGRLLGLLLGIFRLRFAWRRRAQVGEVIPGRCPCRSHPSRRGQDAELKASGLDRYRSRREAKQRPDEESCTEAERGHARCGTENEPVQKGPFQLASDMSPISVGEGREHGRHHHDYKCDRDLHHAKKTTLQESCGDRNTMCH